MQELAIDNLPQPHTTLPTKVLVTTSLKIHGVDHIDRQIDKNCFKTMMKWQPFFTRHSQGISCDIIEILITDWLVAVWSKAALWDCYVSVIYENVTRPATRPPRRPATCTALHTKCTQITYNVLRWTLPLFHHQCAISCTDRGVALVNYVWPIKGRLL